MTANIPRIMAVLITAALTSAAAAQDDKLIEPKADELLRQMSDFLTSQSAFSFEALIVEDQMLSNGQKIQVESIRRVSVLRPGSVRVASDGDLEPWHCWYGNGTLSLMNNDTRNYATIEAPDEIDAMLDHLVEAYGMVIPLADVLVSDPYESAMRNTQVGYYVGLHEVNGAPCHHLAYRTGSVDWQIWINAEGDPLPRKLVIAFVTLAGHPQWSATFDNWDLSPRFEDGYFTFEPEADMTQVEMNVLLSGGVGDPLGEQ